MPKIVTGFNREGLSTFKNFFKIITGQSIDDRQAQAWLDCPEYANFETGDNLHVEIPGYLTLSGYPVLLILDEGMVNFEEVA